MKELKKNQVVIYVIALMLVFAGYLNYTTKSEKIVETSSNIQNNNVIENNQVSEIQNKEDISDEELGDAKLVNNNEVINENKNEGEKNIAKENISENSNIIKERDNYFENSKLERNQMYSQMLEVYNGMLENNNVSETQKAIATEEITKINNIKNSIMICENLISTKGFTENVIFVNSDSINVVVRAEELGQDKIAQIQNIISREMNAQIENIHIMNK